MQNQFVCSPGAPEIIPASVEGVSFVRGLELGYLGAGILILASRLYGSVSKHFPRGARKNKAPRPQTLGDVQNQCFVGVGAVRANTRLKLIKRVIKTY
jgi:hypothetical protein